MKQHSVLCKCMYSTRAEGSQSGRGHLTSARNGIPTTAALEAAAWASSLSTSRSPVWFLRPSVSPGTLQRPLYSNQYGDRGAMQTAGPKSRQGLSPSSAPWATLTTSLARYGHGRKEQQEHYGVANCF